MSCWERARCVMRPNKCCERDYAYCSSSDREKIKIIRLQLLASKIKFQVILLRKANWNSVVSPIDPSQRHIAISNKWRYIEQEKRIIFQRLLPDWLLPIWILPTVCEIRDKMQVIYRGMTSDGAEYNLAKWNLLGGIQFRRVKNCPVFM